MLLTFCQESSGPAGPAPWARGCAEQQQQRCMASCDAWSDAELQEHLGSPTEGCTSTAPSVLENLDLTASEQSKAQLSKYIHAKPSNS